MPRLLDPDRPAADEPSVAQLYDPSLPAEPVQRIELRYHLPEPVFGPGDQLLFVDVGDRDHGGASLWLPDGTGRWRAAGDADQQQIAALCGDGRAVAFHAPSSTLALARAATVRDVVHGIELARVTADFAGASAPAMCADLHAFLATVVDAGIRFAPDAARLEVATATGWRPLACFA